MADYAKLAITATYSENSDYSSPNSVRTFPAYEISTPTDFDEYKVTADTGGGTAVSLAKYAAAGITMLVVKNRDATNYVTATYITAGGGVTTQTVRIPAGGFLVLCDVTSTTALTLAANSAAVKCEVFIAGT